MSTKKKRAIRARLRPKKDTIDHKIVDEIVYDDAKLPELRFEEPAEPLPKPKDEVKELKKKLRSILDRKPVLPYPEEVKLQGWVKELEATLR